MEQIVDYDDVLVGLLNKVYKKGRTPTVDKIDPHGYVTISGSEAARLLAELSVLAAAAVGEAEKNVLATVERLARQCAANPSDHHLHFVGD